jgi:G protein-coupled receptor GPR1
VVGANRLCNRRILRADRSTDVAILFISMHMALQIFPPKSSFLGHDGLYKARHWVLAIWILLPCFTAALAFANPRGAYQAQGAFCWLPIRPFWYRLALSWIPRYLIWLYIMWVAIRIYGHVGYEFRVFGQEQDRSSSNLSAASSVERNAIRKAVKEHRSHVMSNEKNDVDNVAPEDWSVPRPMPSRISPNDSVQNSPANAGRRASLPTWHSPFGGSASPTPPSADIFVNSTSRSNPASRRGSHQIAPGIMAEDFMAPPGFDFTTQRGSVSTMNSNHPSTASPDHILPPIAETRGNSVSAQSSVQTSLGDRAQRQRRRAIQRQLRILFIYPIVYMLMWLIPFVSHCLSYSDRFAQHPIFAISLMSSFCQCFMGFADVSVFCWRERPWRHIPGSDGSFLGSFAFWRNLRADASDTIEWSRRESKAPRHLPSHGATGPNNNSNEKEGTGSETPTLSSSQAGLLASLRRWSMTRKNSTLSTAGSTMTAVTTGAGGARRPAASKRIYTGGRQTKEAELAHERLKLEREDYERRNRASLDGTVSPGRTPGARREWFDVNVSEDSLELGGPVVESGSGTGSVGRDGNVGRS